MEGTPGDRRLALRLSDVLTGVGNAVAEGVGGALKRSGDLLRNAMHAGVGAAVQAEVNDLMGRGLISVDRFEDPVVGVAMAGMVEEAEDGKLDARRIDLLRKAFRSVLLGDPERDPTGAMDEQCFELVRRLTPAQAVILACAYKHRSSFLDTPPVNRGSLFHRVLAEETGFRFNEVLHPICDSLRELGLTTRVAGWDENTGFLTRFGVAFCEFLNRGMDADPETGGVGSGDSTR